MQKLIGVHISKRCMFVVKVTFDQEDMTVQYITL